MPQTYLRFKRNMVESRFTPIVFSLIAITMRLGMFLSTGIERNQYPTSFAWHIISPLFSNIWISLATSTASIFAIAFIVSQLNLRFNLIRFRTALPFSMLVLFFSIHPLFLPISPNYISAVFILLAFFPLLQSYQHHAPRNFAFKSGVLIALAGTFQVYTLAFFPLWLYGESSMHGFRIKSSLSLLIGGILVFWNVAGFYFIFDNLDSFLIPFRYFGEIDFSIPLFTSVQWAGIGILVALSGMFLVLDYQVFRRERVLTQKTLSFTVLIIISSFVLHFIYLRQSLSFIYFITIMLSIIVAHYYSHIKSKWQVYSFIILLIGLFLLYTNYLIGNPLLLHQ